MIVDKYRQRVWGQIQQKLKESFNNYFDAMTDADLQDILEHANIIERYRRENFEICLEHADQDKIIEYLIEDYELYR